MPFLQCFSLFTILFLGLGSCTSEKPFLRPWKHRALTREEVADALKPSLLQGHFPTRLETSQGLMRANYGIDLKLQSKMEQLFESYQPDYGAFVAIHPATGAIRALISYQRSEKNTHWALEGSFPSASVFKVITAAAAIEHENLSAESVIPFHGRSTTLYRSQLLKDAPPRWTRYFTLREAFAKSANPAFARIGALQLGPSRLRQYASKFGFNRTLASDVPFQTGSVHIPDHLWGLAESASGFTLKSTLSPLHGALIAASVVNDGTMMQPFLIESLEAPETNAFAYHVSPHILSQALSEEGARELRILMRETVQKGTSRPSFRGFYRIASHQHIEVGGKTGSLTGSDPKGKVDWFIGYADSGAEQLAFAALTVHEQYWRVKSAYLARKAIETYFHPTTIALRLANHEAERTQANPS
jgi:penicillin-binding protein A